MIVASNAPSRIRQIRSETKFLAAEVQMVQIDHAAKLKTTQYLTGKTIRA